MIFSTAARTSTFPTTFPRRWNRWKTGLKRYPDDVKLKKLYELLKQQQPATIAKQPVATKPEPAVATESIATAEIKQPAEPAAVPAEFAATKAERTEPVRPEKRGQQKQQPPQTSEEKQGGEKPENQNEQGQPVAAGQMTPEEAKRLLDAQKGDEQFLQLKPQGKPQNQTQPVKDW